MAPQALHLHVASIIPKQISSKVILKSFTSLGTTTLASQSRFDPNWAVAQDLELELKSKFEPKLES